MFKLNRMTHYAIVVLGFLAYCSGDILATAKPAGLIDLNQLTVAKGSKPLVVTDLLDTQRGVHGGFRLARQSSIISRVETNEAMEGPILVNGCVHRAQDPRTVSNCCFTSQNWNRVNLALRDARNIVSLEGLIDSAQLFAPVLARPVQERVIDHKVPSARQVEMSS